MQQACNMDLGEHFPAILAHGPSGVASVRMDALGVNPTGPVLNAMSFQQSFSTWC